MQVHIQGPKRNLNFYIKYFSSHVLSHQEYIYTYINTLLHVNFHPSYSPEVVYWTSDHWVAGSNPLGGHVFDH